MAHERLACEEIERDEEWTQNLCSLGKEQGKGMSLTVTSSVTSKETRAHGKEWGGPRSY